MKIKYMFVIGFIDYSKALNKAFIGSYPDI